MTHVASVQLGMTTLDTVIGRLRIVARDRVLCAISFGDDWSRDERALLRRYPGAEIAHHPDPAGVVTALTRYFAGEIHALDGLDADPGGTPFQSRVWKALRTIPTGGTISYAELARRIGAPSAVRAVGAANGANPIPLVIPCHRVIGADARLVGYGGGLDRKAWLLRHEGASLPLLVSPRRAMGH